MAKLFTDFAITFFIHPCFDLCFKVHDMIKQETATIVFKSISGLAPTYLSTLFTRNSTRDIVNLRNCDTDLLAPRMKTSNGQKAFSFRGAKGWNGLKHEV